MNKLNRFKAIFYAIALLVLGGIIGTMIKSAMPATRQTLRLGRVDEIVKIMSDRLSAKLALTDEQKRRIEPMIKKAAMEMEASHLEALVRVNRTLDRLHEEINPELIPEQREKMRELETERADRMWEKYHFRPGMTNAPASN